MDEIIEGFFYPRTLPFTSIPCVSIYLFLVIIFKSILLVMKSFVHLKVK